MRASVIPASIAAVLVAAGAAWATAVADPPATDQYGPNRVSVCHGAGTTSRYVDLVIARSALPTHLRHGDTVGACVYGSVNDRGVVTLANARGQAVTTLRRGQAYSIVVRDRSRRQNFRIVGPGVDRGTTLSFVGTVRWRLSFARGTYRYRSDNRPAVARSFVAR